MDHGRSSARPGGSSLALACLLQMALFLPLSFSAAVPKSIDVIIPPLLVEGPPQGELLFHVTHDPERDPENLTIPCRADSLPPPSYLWFKDGTHFNTETSRVTVLEEEGTIVFTNPLPEDEGDYQCVATNSAGSVFSDITNVRRAVTISFPKSEPRVVTAVLGQPLALQCANPGGYPVPSLHWVLQRSDGSIRSVRPERATVDEEGTLWFGAVSLQDASDDALYACAASSATSEREIFVVEGKGSVTLKEAEPDEGSLFSLNLQTEYRIGNWVYLNVTSSADGRDVTVPESETEPFLQHVTEGEETVLVGADFRLYCIYGGRPSPKIRWWREDGKDIPDEDLIEAGKVLEVKEVLPEDEGTYFCQAKNPVGEGITHSFTVNVEAKPTITIEPGTVNQPIGESASFQCAARGEPEPLLTWSINGEPLNGKHQEMLTFSSLTIDDKGVIACNASNRHGYAYSAGFLNVLSFPPEFTKEPDDVSGFVGQSVTLPCEVYGAPDPTVEWFRVNEEGEEVPVDTEDERFKVSDVSLVIRSLSDETKGKFICMARNKFSSVSSSAFVKLIMSTVVNVHSPSTLIKAGDTIDIMCEVSVDKNLSADVTWMKDNFPVDFGNPRITSERGASEHNSATENYNRTLTIARAEGHDSGIYSCVSKTDQDEAEGSFIVMVEDVPMSPVIEKIKCATREAYLHWSSKGENNSPIIGFIVQSQTELNKDKWEETRNDIPASKNSFRVELNPGLTHVFRVMALNRVGASDPSPPSDPCVADGAPPDYSPRNTSVRMVDSSTLKVSWDPVVPREHNGPDFQYEVRWKRVQGDHDDVDDDDDDEDDDVTFAEDDVDRGKWSKIVIEDWEQTDVEIEGLRPHTQYKVRVAAVNSFGSSPIEEDNLVYTEAGKPEKAPTYLRVRRVKSSSAILHWVPVPLTQVFGPLVGYEVELRKVSESEGNEEDLQEAEFVLAKGKTSHSKLSDLEAYTDYEARVRVVNLKFKGPYTKPIRFRTAEGDASPVLDLRARALSSSSLIVEWGPPEIPRGVVRQYLVQFRPVYADEGEGDVKEVLTKEEEPRAKLADLEENTLYRISVFAINGHGFGERSVVDAETEKTESSLPVPPVFTWGMVNTSPSTTTSRALLDRNDDGEIDDIDAKFHNVILADVDGDGDVDKDDVLDTDNDGDIDSDDFDVADINNDGVVDRKDVMAADRDGDGDVDEYDVGDEDGDGDFDGDDVLAADEDGDGDIDAADEDNEGVILMDVDRDGDIDEDDAIDVDGDGDIDSDDLSILDIDNDGDIDMDDVKLRDKDGDGDIDAADIVDFDEDGVIDEDDLNVRDVDGDGDIDKTDFVYRHTFVADTDGDGDVDADDVLDTDGDGDIDSQDMDVADINNDGVVDIRDVEAADRDGDGDVDAMDIGDEDGDGDIDSVDVVMADEDGDGDIDADDEDDNGVFFKDRDGDGDLDEDDVTDMDGDGDVDHMDIAILDVNDDGKIDEEDLIIIDKDGDGDVDRADVADFDGDGMVDEDDLEMIDRDGDGDVDAKDILHQRTYLKDTDNDGDIDVDDVLDMDGDGDIDEEDIAAADLDDDGDVDADDVTAFDRDGDGDLDANDMSDLDGDGRIDEDDFDVMDRDGDGDIDKQDYKLRHVFLIDSNKDGKVDEKDVLDTDGDGDIDQHDIDVADINNDGKVTRADIRAGDVDGDGDVDAADIGDEDGDGDIDGKDVEAADEDGDGDIDSADDDGESVLLMDRNKDGTIDENDVSDVDGDGDVDEYDLRALDIDNDGDVDEEDLQRGDRDKDGDIDAADITDLDEDGDVDGNDLIISDRDGDGDIDDSDRRNKDILLGDADGDGDIDSEDVLDTDRDGDIDGEDFAAADINNDREITIDDVLAADADGDGDVDKDDIGDLDGDGDVDADDLEMADRDGDGDIDRADKGEGIELDINWRPDFDSHPGSEFYIRYRPVGEERWRKSPVEENSLHQKLRGFDPYTAYEVQMVAKDGDFETPSNISVIGPFAQPPMEDPTVGAMMEDVDPLMMTWFIVAVIAAVIMICIVLFSVWVYNQRLSRVSELRAQLYEGYEPPPVVAKKDVEAGIPPEKEVEEPLTATDKQRQQMSALLKRQETVQSVDSFASHDDDFAEYGDESMGTTFNEDGSLIFHKE